MIAAQVGYPSAKADPFAAKDVIEVDRAEAARIFAYVASRSLAYEIGAPPPQGVRKVALESLSDLGPDAVFFTNGRWGTGATSFGWAPLSGSTFDAGVIGFDASHAFIFWREEED